MIFIIGLHWFSTQLFIYACFFNTTYLFAVILMWCTGEQYHQWSPWMTWTSCQIAYGYPQRSRRRLCNGQRVASVCPGSSFEYVPCTMNIKISLSISINYFLSLSLASVVSFTIAVYLES